MILIANWKSHKVINQAEEWLHSFHDKLNSEKVDLSNKEIIICPSFTLFEHAHYCSKNLNLPIKFGAQNISPYDAGAHTGEVNGEQIKEMADYVIVGHSERRDNFKENDKILEEKVRQAQKYGLKIIFCIQNEQTPIPKNIDIVAYEPPSAIGTGKPDTPENAEEIAKITKEKTGIKYVLYGGSITSGNVRGFTQMPSIDGLLVGGASLNPQEFLEIIKNA